MDIYDQLSMKLFGFTGLGMLSVLVILVDNKTISGKIGSLFILSSL
jgi:hypothetical protein